MVPTPNEQPESKAWPVAALDRANKIIGEQADEMSALQTQLDETEVLLRKLLEALIGSMKDPRSRAELVVLRVVDALKRRLGIE